VLLRLSYLALTGMVTLLRLLPMSNTDKDVEILVLRHQLAVLQRRVDKPRLTSADRAFLAALLHKLPRPTLRQLHLIVSPDTVLCWHRDLLRHHHSRVSRGGSLWGRTRRHQSGQTAGINLLASKRCRDRGTCRAAPAPGPISAARHAGPTSTSPPNSSVGQRGQVRSPMGWHIRRQ
jgi:hypothetical protein